MKPKEFIQKILIEELRDIVFRHPYISFSLIATGIEFLGKCMITDRPNWHDIPPDKAFNKGLEILETIDKRYSDSALNLRDELRNGFAHTLSPKSKIALSELKHGAIQFSDYQDKKVLVSEVFFGDFVKCCLIVINTSFPEDNKMNNEFLVMV